MSKTSTFGKILKKTIDEKGISQRWVADAAGTTEATISRYISGAHSPSVLEVLVGISRGLNVSTDYLLGLSQIENPKSDTTAEERIILSCIRKASLDDMEVVMTLLKKYMSQSERITLETIYQEEKKTG